MPAIITPDNRERNSEILRHYARGLTFSQIAYVMNISRNAVAGVVNRAGAGNRGGTKLPFDDLTGRIFGHWRVLCSMGRSGSNHLYLCQCSCGKRKHVIAGNLRHGFSKSCGCVSRMTKRAAA